MTVALLIALLAHPAFEVRDSAHESLHRLGPLACPPPNRCDGQPRSGGGKVDAAAWVAGRAVRAVGVNQ
jgi:hypothetical protein